MANEDIETVVEIEYTNYRGETSRRRIVPGEMWFGSTEWHPEAQWQLNALDLSKGERRSFAMRDIHSWRSALEVPARRK